jgi:pimeloyl-ACP methyl ester carboxylesterase
MTVAYALIRHRDRSRPAAGTVVPDPGGPGDSPIYEAAPYASAFADLLRDHDLLLVDPRGVNRSEAADCGLDAIPATRAGFVEAVAACGRALGARARDYTSAATADDLDDVRAHLGVARLDLLGESYGTYLMTVYAQRHPAHVRSIVLSSAYPLAFDMWARPSAAAARRSITLMCARSRGACDGPTVLAQLATLAGRLRAHPVPYDAGDGPRVVDDTALASIVYQWASEAQPLARVPAMVRDALAGDTGPLVAAAQEVQPFTGSATDQPFNVAVAAAVSCNDYPTLWDRRAPVDVRLRQFAAGRAALPDADFWPFGKVAWTSAISDRGNTCVRWPDRGAPAQRTTGPFADVPVLVVSGDLDTNTPTAEGRAAAAQFRRGGVLEVPNVGHIAEREPSGCVAALETRFIRTGRTGDTGCLSRIPPVL